MSPHPHHSHGGYAPMMHQGRDLVIPALFAPSFHNQAHPNMHQSMQQSLSMQHHYGQQQQQHQQPHMHMSPHVPSVSGSQTVRPIIGSQMNMPVPNMNPSSSAMERPTSSWEVRSKQRPTEENEYVAPLASENNHGVFPSKYGVSKDNHASFVDHQSSITNLDVVLSSERQQQQQQQYPSRVRPNMGNFSQQSLMSLSEDLMGTSLSNFGGDNANYLSALFNSSLKITTNNKPSTNRINMASSGHLAGTMEISVNTLDKEEDLSYFGDSAMMKMTESQAEMSFGNVFEDNA
jgi:hypothetical protein